MTQKKHRTRLNVVGAASFSLVFLAGCATPTAPTMDEYVVRQFASQGYQNDAKYGGIATTYFSWWRATHELDLALTLPTRAGRFPLVIYIPGLGEARTAGEVWRSVWAEAGYAVLTLQPLVADRDAWSSPQARAGDFAALARIRFTEREMASRIAALHATLSELKRRQAAHEAALERIDMSRITVAGYDLGADTALRFAASNTAATAQDAWPIQAVIAISPTNHGVVAGSMTGMHMPVLVVSGDSDVDLLGSVSSPSERRKAFTALPAGNKFMLNLNRCNHQQLAGASLYLAAEAVPKRKDKEQGPHRRGGDAEPSTSVAEPAATGATNLPTAQALGATVLRGFSHAFLDAYIRNEPSASEWLKRQSKRWLGAYADIQTK